MDFEKKYKVALETAREWIADGGSDPAKVALEAIFPELRESEDERIRKHLVEVVELYWGKTNDPDKAKDLAYLEKQKEKSEIPINASVCSEKLSNRSELNDFEIRLMDCMLSAQQYRQGSIDWDIVKSWAEELSELIEQPKQEWSEDDEKCLQELMQHIEHCVTVYGASQPEWQQWLNLLKSLRPQPQGTYKQVIHTIFGMLKNKDFYEIQPSHRVSLLNDIRVKCKDAIECAPILDEPSWKPSEEQLNELHYALVPGYAYNGDVLQGLYADLKKLMEEYK